MVLYGTQLCAAFVDGVDSCIKLVQSIDRIRLGFQADGCRSGGVYRRTGVWDARCDGVNCAVLDIQSCRGRAGQGDGDGLPVTRSEEHTSELQYLMRISYAV